MVIQKDQGVLPCRRQALREALAQRLAPLQALSSLRQFVQRRLRPAASSAQRVALLHNRTPRPSQREATRDTPKPFALTWLQVMLHASVPRRAPIGALWLPSLFLARRLRGCLRARPPFGPCGLLSRQTLACPGPRPPHRFPKVFDHMERTDLMRPLVQNLAQRLGGEMGTIGGDAQERQGADLSGAVASSEKRAPSIRVGGMIQDRRAQTLVAAMIDRGAHTAGTVVPCVEGDRARTLSACPVEKGHAHARLRLFFPPPRPSFAAGHRAHTPGGRATGANWLVDRATQRPPRCAQP